MKLEVGMYVRTKDGIIDKVIIDYNGHCANPNCEYKHISCAKNYYDEDKIVKASYNIIDLIEEGDYVNGHRVNKVVIGSSCSFVLLEEVGSYVDNPDDIDEEDIKTIVTKEQFSSIEYRLGDDK